MGMRVAILACLVAVSGSIPSAYGQTTTLRYQWVKGDQVRYRITQLTDATMSGLLGIGEMRVEQYLVQVERMVVQDVAVDGTPRSVRPSSRCGWR